MFKTKVALRVFMAHTRLLWYYFFCVIRINFSSNYLEMIVNKIPVTEFVYISRFLVKWNNAI